MSDEVSSAIAALVERENHVLVVAAAWQLAEYAHQINEGRHVVLDTHNVEADLVKRMGPKPASVTRRLVDTIDYRRVRTMEHHIGSWVDEVWVCSEDDATLWRSIHGRRAVTRVVPNTVSGNPSSPGVQRRDRHTLLLTGTFSYPPNIAAAQELVHAILPLVRRDLPEAQVELVGREPDRVVIDLDNPGGGVRVIGAVPDMQPYIENALALVVPIRSGGGTRLKILEAMAAGLPVISTAKGMEGIDAIPGTHLMIGETPAELASAIVDLVRDPEGRSGMVNRARAFVADRYGEAALDRVIDEAISAMGVVS